MATIVQGLGADRAAGLAQAIRRIETGAGSRRSRPPSAASAVLAPGGGIGPAIALGFAPIDQVLRGGGLAAGSHQMAAPVGHEAWASGFGLAMIGRLMRTPGARSVMLIQSGDAESEQGPWAAEGLRALGLDLGRVGLVRVRTAQQALQVADETLKAGAVSAVLLEAGARARIDLALTRRFNLAAQRSGALALLVGGEDDATSAALTRWRVTPVLSRMRDLRGARDGLGPPRFSLTLTRNRLGALGQWSVEWDCEQGVFQPIGSAVPASVAALASGRARPPHDAVFADPWPLGAHRQAG